jgi:hypothetical protein
MALYLGDLHEGSHIVILSEVGDLKGIYRTSPRNPSLLLIGHGSYLPHFAERAHSGSQDTLWYSSLSSPPLITAFEMLHLRPITIMNEMLRQIRGPDEIWRQHCSILIVYFPVTGLANLIFCDTCQRVHVSQRMHGWMSIVTSAMAVSKTHGDARG